MEHSIAACQALQRSPFITSLASLQSSTADRQSLRFACLCRRSVQTSYSLGSGRTPTKVNKRSGLQAGTRKEPLSRTTRTAATPESQKAEAESLSKPDDSEEGVSDADVQASMAAAAGLLGSADTSTTWSLKDEIEGMTDEPVYVLKQEKPRPKEPKEVIFELLFLLGGMLDRPFEGGGQGMEASAEVVIERVEAEMEKAREKGATNDQITELGRYVKLLAMDMKLVGAARKFETLEARCKTAQEKIKGAMQRTEALDG